MQENRFDPLELIKEILMFLGVTAVIFIWMMLMQLILSFVALSYITMKLKWMFVVAGAVTVFFDIFYVVGRVKKRNKSK